MTPAEERACEVVGWEAGYIIDNLEDAGLQIVIDPTNPRSRMPICPRCHRVLEPEMILREESFTACRYCGKAVELKEVFRAQVSESVELVENE